MAKGDIVLITFPFTDLSGNKLRPCVVLAETKEDMTVCFITSQLQWSVATDISLTPSPLNRLHKPSLIRVSKMATLDKSLIVGLMGHLTMEEVRLLDMSLKSIFKLDP